MSFLGAQTLYVHLIRRQPWSWARYMLLRMYNTYFITIFTFPCKNRVPELSLLSVIAHFNIYYDCIGKSKMNIIFDAKHFRSCHSSLSYDRILNWPISYMFNINVYGLYLCISLILRDSICGCWGRARMNCPSNMKKRE